MAPSPPPAQAQLPLDEPTARALVLDLYHWARRCLDAGNVVGNPNVTLDNGEMLYWGHEWQWGYFKHPPLAAWMAESSFLLTGHSLLGVWLAARVCIAVCYWAVWRLARRVVSPSAALLAVVALEASYYFTYEARDLNNNVAPRPFWALAVLALFIAVFEKRIYAWAAAGAFLGIAALGKYDAIVLALVMLLYSICDPRGRQAWRTSGPYLLLATALAVISPHLVWLVQNDFPTFRYFRECCVREDHRAVVSHLGIHHLAYPLEFLTAHAVLLLPVLAVCAFALRRDWSIRHLDAEGQAQRRFILTMALGPFVCFLLISGVLGVHFAWEWGHMLWTWLPLALFVVWETNESRQRCRAIVRWCALAGAVFLTASMAKSYGYPYVKHLGLNRHFPGCEVAQQVTERWHQQVAAPLSIVGGDAWIASNVGLYAPERPSVYCDLNSEHSPWVDDEKLKRRGGVIVWQEGTAGGYTIEGALTRFPTAQEAPPVVARMQTGASVSPVTIRVAIVPPAAQVR